jgi:hypothetical protein
VAAAVSSWEVLGLHIRELFRFYGDKVESVRCEPQFNLTVFQSGDLRCGQLRFPVELFYLIGRGIEGTAHGRIARQHVSLITVDALNGDLRIRRNAVENQFQRVCCSVLIGGGAEGDF